MESPKETCKPDSLIWPGRRQIGRLSCDPGHNAPEPRISTAGRTDMYRGRDRNRNLPGYVWQPLLLMPNQFSCESAAREAHGELCSKPKDGIVPSCVNGQYIKRREFGLLCLNKRANQSFVDLDFRSRSAAIHVEILNKILPEAIGPLSDCTPRPLSAHLSRNPLSACTPFRLSFL